MARRRFPAEPGDHCSWMTAMCSRADSGARDLAAKASRSRSGEGDCRIQKAPGLGDEQLWVRRSRPQRRAALGIAGPSESRPPDTDGRSASSPTFVEFNFDDQCYKCSDASDTPLPGSCRTVETGDFR